MAIGGYGCNAEMAAREKPPAGNKQGRDVSQVRQGATMLLNSVLLPLIVLIVTFAFNKGIACISRDKDLSFWNREDSLAWPDWLSSGAITVGLLGYQLVVAREIQPLQYLGVLFLIASSLAAPLLVKSYGYTPATGGGEPKLRRWRGIFWPNLLALTANDCSRFCRAPSHSCSRRLTGEARTNRRRPVRNLRGLHCSSGCTAYESYRRLGGHGRSARDLFCGYCADLRSPAGNRSPSESRR